MLNAPLKLLLIEDNPGDARLIQEELSGEMDIFFDVVTATTLEEALTNIEKDKFDVILSDLGLPDSQGIDTFLKIHDKEKGLPIVILSGNKDENLALSAVQKGAQDYLVKSEVNNILLKRTIRYAIERHKVYKELEETKAELERCKKLLLPN